MYRYILSLAHLALQVAMDAGDLRLAHKLSEVIDLAKEGRRRELGEAGDGGAKVEEEPPAPSPSHEEVGSDR